MPEGWAPSRRNANHGEQSLMIAPTNEHAPRVSMEIWRPLAWNQSASAYVERHVQALLTAEGTDHGHRLPDGKYDPTRAARTDDGKLEVARKTFRWHLDETRGGHHGFCGAVTDGKSVQVVCLYAHDEDRMRMYGSVGSALMRSVEVLDKTKATPVTRIAPGEQHDEEAPREPSCRPSEPVAPSTTI
jgi:hypothetical protein